MDINERLAERRKERELEAATRKIDTLYEELVEKKSPENVTANRQDFGGITDYEKIVKIVKDDLEKNYHLKKMAVVNIRPWVWFVVVFGILGSFMAIGESFFIGGILFLGMVIWYLFYQIKSRESEIIKSLVAVYDDKNDKNKKSK